jgi:hypothetical protein
MPGRYQFEYNTGNGDIRIYDIFNDGQIQERIAKSNDVHFISTREALERLDTMLGFAMRNKEKFKHTSLYDKITKTKLDMLMTIKNFMLENTVDESEVRWS